jgi:hypothetical protein
MLSEVQINVNNKPADPNVDIKQLESLKSPPILMNNGKPISILNFYFIKKRKLKVL